MTHHRQQHIHALREYLYILREEINKEINRLLEKFAQDHPREGITNVILDEEDILSEADSLEILGLVIQTLILHDQLLETSEELRKCVDMDSAFIEDLDPVVARIIEGQIDPFDADAAGTINEQKEKKSMKTPVENEIRTENDKISPEDQFITRQDLLRIARLALIFSISLILPGYLYFAGLQLGWAIALFVGFLLVAWLGYSIKR